MRSNSDHNPGASGNGTASGCNSATNSPNRTRSSATASADTSRVSLPPDTNMPQVSRAALTTKPPPERQPVYINPTGNLDRSGVHEVPST